MQVLQARHFPSVHFILLLTLSYLVFPLSQLKSHQVWQALPLDVPPHVLVHPFIVNASHASQLLDKVDVVALKPEGERVLKNLECLQFTVLLAKCLNESLQLHCVEIKLVSGEVKRQQIWHVLQLLSDTSRQFVVVEN
jgi:hypothetical protein